jgi:hypothetical protein
MNNGRYTSQFPSHTCTHSFILTHDLQLTRLAHHWRRVHLKAATDHIVRLFPHST